MLTLGGNTKADGRVGRQLAGKGLRVEDVLEVGFPDEQVLILGGRCEVVSLVLRFGFQVSGLGLRI